MPRLVLMNNSLERSLTNLVVEVRTGTRNVSLDGEHISGDWDNKGRSHRIGAGRPMALNVLNPFLSRNDLVNAVLDFTQRYGPLTIPFSAATSFRFSVADWNMARKRICVLWKAASSGTKRRWPLSIPLDQSDGDHFSFEDGQLTFRTQSLHTYMALEIARIPMKGFRRCTNFSYGCKSPYFFSDDFREKYCSEACSHEAKKRAKLDWWNREKRGKKNVTHKAR